MKKALLPGQAVYLLAGIFSCSLCGTAFGNSPGGGTGTGPNVTVTNNGNGTVTLANGIVSILIDTAGARLNGTTYTYNNGGTPVTSNVLEGPYGPGRGNYYYGGYSLGSAASLTPWVSTPPAMAAAMGTSSCPGPRPLAEKWRCIFRCCVAPQVTIPPRR